MLYKIFCPAIVAMFWNKHVKRRRRRRRAKPRWGVTRVFPGHRLICIAKAGATNLSRRRAGIYERFDTGSMGTP
jgi:hypothetical protein